MNNRLIKSNDAGGGACTNTVDLYNPFPDGGGLALYQLNGDATDVSGNYDGTATNVTYGAGQFGQAGVFNGSSSSINTNFAQNTSNAFSWSLWFNADSTQNGLALIIDTTSNVSPYPGVGIGLSGNTELYAFIGGSTFPTSTTITSNSWVHTVYTNDGNGNFSFYVNGIAIFTNVFQTTNVYSGQNILLGDTTTWNKFKGSIDQVRIFNRALRPYEVEALYTEEYCTPTIVPSEHFNTVLFTGNGSAKSITSVGFQPDLVWWKNRDILAWHQLHDSVRGAGNRLFSNDTSATQYDAQSLTSFDAQGFSIGTSSDFTGDCVAWNFKAGGAAVTNTDGTITSQVSANTEAGFSIVSYNSPTSLNTTSTVGHGLEKKPDVVIIKNRDWAPAGAGWITIHSSIPSKAIYLDITIEALTSEFTYYIGNEPDDNVFSVREDSFPGPTYRYRAAGGGYDYIAYCFAEVEGFSNFGSYVGTGASGNTIVTGFEPAMVIAKMTSSTDNWRIYDNKRIDSVLYPNLSNQEDIANHITFLENGFTWNTNNSNSTGQEFIYMAFAADPTTIEPSLEDSFNTVTWTGDAGNTGNTLSKTVTGVNFQPDLVWGKNRDYTGSSHVWFDSVRSPEKWLSSNNANAENESIYTQATILPDGFTTGTSDGLNKANNDFVAWAWKGAELPAINSNGSIPSVVSANPAAGFSIVTWKGNTTAGNTIGHGLSSAPDMIIAKNYTQPIAQRWVIGHSGLDASSPWNYYLEFDSDARAINNNRSFNGTAPNDSVFTIGGDTQINDNDMIAYCFAEVAGFSKFGTYVGTGTTSGATVDCGFEPAFIMIKATDVSGRNWVIFDNKRDTTNPRDNFIYANFSEAELVNSTNKIDFLQNGFQIVGTGGNTNQSGATFIYMAFANQF